MIGVFVISDDEPLVVEPPGGRPTPRPSPTGAPPSATSAGGDGGGAGALQVELSEWKVTGENGQPLPDAEAGEITFEAHNEGTTPHELAIIKTDTDPADLPISRGAVDENEAGELIGRIDAFAGGSVEEDTFRLDAGQYVLLCNIPGHYQQGMHASLTVK
jgi:uncharacterized cupredoxin-like copper-binding protein